MERMHTSFRTTSYDSSLYFFDVLCAMYVAHLQLQAV